MNSAPQLAINPTIDFAALAQRMRSRRRALVPDFLATDGARALLEALQADQRWNVVTTLRGQHQDLDAAAMAAKEPAEKARFLAHVHEPARRGEFQYLFGNIPIYDNWRKGARERPLMNAAVEFLNSPAMIAFARQATRADDIAFADAQATRYLPGNFLTWHDDGVAGKDRRAAYILNLTEDWRPDYGGLTHFLGTDGEVEETFTPRYNALALFLVPQPHAVGAVAPFAPRPRYAITGWFRAGEDCS